MSKMVLRVVNEVEHRTRLKDVIETSGIKQRWLCDKANISPGALSMIVNGKTLPNLRTAQKIAKTLNTTVDYLWPLPEEDDEK